MKQYCCTEITAILENVAIVKNLGAFQFVAK
jgi:hypothetical protein